MRFNFLAFPVIAFLAGLAGGWTSRFLPSSQSSAPRFGVIQATRIELTDRVGRTRAFIGTDSERNTALVFLDDQARERAMFGVSGYKPYAPKLTMTGKDGRESLGFLSLRR
jgi:hypothetical protein